MHRTRRLPFHIADILRSVSDAIITIDADERITSMNAAAEAITGVPEPEAIGRKCVEVVRTDVWSSRSPLTAVWERDETVVHFQVPLEGRMGRRFMVSMSTSPLKNEAGDKIGAILSIRHIRPFRRLLSALQQSGDPGVTKDGELRLIDEREGKPAFVIGKSQQMQEIFKLVRVVAKSDVTVLIGGESGTGKALLASTIHALSHRRDGPFIEVSCAALSEGVLESELFGHVRGSFTGALRDKPGRFELADKGTVFLDEVGEISPAVQVKLLRILQEREFERVGGSRTIKTDVRVVAATNRDLREAVREGRFREDLFYRLHVIPITLPPLRQRKEDIPLLVEYILHSLQVKIPHRVLGVSPEALGALMAYDWPGNVRELENALQFALVQTSGGTISRHSLPPWIGVAGERAHEGEKALIKGVERGERETIVRQLAQCRGKLSATAKALGVGRTTLWRKMKRYQISKT